MPLLYYSNWNYKIFFQKPSRNESILAILMFAEYMIYAIVVNEILDFAGLYSAVSDTSTPEFLFSLIFF